MLANWDADGLGADGVVTGLGTIGGRRVAADGQRSDRQGGFVGRRRPSRRSSGSRSGRCSLRAADGLPRRLGGGADHRPGADVPGPPRRRADLPQRGAAVGPGAAGLRAVRAVCRRRRLHPGLLRRRDHARGQRLDVPRLAAHGRDGHRREGDARGDGRRADAHRRLRLRPLPGRRPTRRRSTLAKRYLSLHAGELARAAAAVAAGASRPPTRRSREIVPADENTAVRHARADRRRWSTRARSSRSTRAGPRS